MKKFHQTSTSEYELVSSDANYLIEQYSQIQQFISASFTTDFHKLLSKPELKGRIIEWYSDSSLGLQAVELLSNNERTKALAIYNARRHDIERKCQFLAKSNDYDEKVWGRILSDTFNPDHVQIFSDGTEIVLVWGIQSRKGKDYTLPYTVYMPYIISTESPEEKSQESSSVVEDGTIEELLGPTSEIATDVEDDDVLTSSSESSTDSSELDSLPESIDENIEPSPDIQAPKLKRPVNANRKPKHWFYTMLDGIENSARRYWWLWILLLLILVFMIWWFSGKEVSIAGSNTAEIEREYREIMPESPRTRKTPIDTTRFRDDEAGGVVVAGLVNIAMVDEKEKFMQMAVDLKSNFPDSTYEIVYYDDVTHRLQLNFPEQEKDIKNSIRTKLAAYKLLVWDESVFKTTMSFNDPFFADNRKSWHLSMVNAQAAWNVTIGDTSIVVAVIDDGFDLTHPELRGKNIVKPYNVVTDNDRITASEEVLHGTHVAALAIGNGNNGSGSCGVAPGCSFMPIQAGSVGGFFSGTDIIDGLLYALNNGADVVNLSLGKMFGDAIGGLTQDQYNQIIDGYGKDEEQFWKELFALADEKNVSIVLAGGNEALPIGLDPMQRSESTLKVVAIGPNLKRAVFSNYPLPAQGNQNFISSPGVQIFSAVPDGQYLPLDGTSMAAPIVSGAIALIKTRRSDLKNSDIFELLSSSGRPSTDGRDPAILQIDKAIYGLRP
jgi:subtilisin family serine protease